MNEFNEYFSDLGVSQVVRSRVERFFKIYRSLFPGITFEDIFISNSVDENGKFVFGSLWIWAGERWFEARNFQLQDKFDAMHTSGVRYWIISSEKYDMDEEVTDESRLSIEATFTNQLKGDFAATGINCIYLDRIIRSRLLEVVG
jgi:hypothetical protein